jgi:hypothetical protein
MAARVAHDGRGGRQRKDEGRQQQGSKSAERIVMQVDGA